MFSVLKQLIESHCKQKKILMAFKICIEEITTSNHSNHDIFTICQLAETRVFVFTLFNSVK